MTFLELVNFVQRRLREDEVTDVSSDAHSKLLGDLVNQAKRRVEDAHQWLMLRNTIQVTTSAGTYAYTLTGAGTRYRLLEDEYGRKQVLHDSDGSLVVHRPGGWMTRALREDTTQNKPRNFDLNGQSSNDPIVNFHSIPDAAYTINFDLVLPQDDFVAGTDEAVELTVPDYPVALHAVALAIAERGEEGSIVASEAFAMANNALAEAVAIDKANLSEEDTWEIW